MNTELTDVIQEQINKVPAEVRAAVTSPELRKKIKEIGDRHKLHIDQLGILEDETVLIMIGLEDPTNFLNNLVQEVRIEKTTAEKVEQEISDQIFVPIRESMKKFMAEQESGNQVKISSAPAAVATVPTMPPVSKLPPLPHASPMTSPPSAPFAAASLPKAPTPPVPPPPQKPTAALPMHTADIMLSEKTVTTAPPVAPKAADVLPPAPGLYKKDPYREPAE